MRDNTIKIPADSKFGSWTVLHYAGTRGHSSFWLCVCDCGQFQSVNGYTLRNGDSTKCVQCKMRALQSEENARKSLETRLAKRPKGTSALNELFGIYKINAKKRGYAFDLSKETFQKIVAQDCHYCGRKPANVITPYNAAFGILIYNGIDRKDNSLGYTEANSLPCCEVCNRAKLTMSYEEFKAWIIKAYTHLEGAKNGR